MVENEAAEILSQADSMPATERWAHLVNAAVDLHARGRLDAAQALLEPVVAETTKDENASTDIRSARSAALINLAVVHVARGDDLALSRAAELLDAAEEDARAIGLDSRLGSIEVNRARIASLRGDLAGARRALARAEEHYAGSPRDLAWAKRALGASMAAAGQLEAAAEQQERARELFAAAGDAEQADMTDVGLVAIRHQLGHAVDPRERARLETVMRRLPAEPAIQLAGNLGNLAMADDLDAAERLWQWARDRSGDEGRTVDRARAELALAGVTRRRGDLKRALEQTEAATRRLRDHGAWEAAARGDVNATLLLAQIADADPARHGELLGHAADRATRAVAELDRFRHALPSAADRRALLRHRYPQLFVVALQAARNAHRPDLAAALIERSRVQPVLAARRADGGGFLEPRPVCARPGSPPLAGNGVPVVLSEHAERLAGPGALWLSWWHGDADLLRCLVTPTDTTVSGTDFPHEARTLLDRCLARVAAAELDLADGDRTLAARLALWRAAAGPLLRDPKLARAIARDVPDKAQVEMRARLRSIDRLDLDELTYPLAEAALGLTLLDKLLEQPAGRRPRLVVAPPRELADFPWPILPLRRRNSGEAIRSVPRLLDRADVVVGLPAGLTTHAPHGDRGRGTLAVLDPLGNLPWARRMPVDAVRIGRGSPAPATRDVLLDRLKEPWAMLVVAAHFRAGVPDDPASAAILLSNGRGGVDRLTATELAATSPPPVCVILGCDGSGGVVGDEWTGVATGLVWGGASWVLTTTWPAVEDRYTAKNDAALVACAQSQGPRAGLWAWQRARLESWRREPADAAASPYRWAGTIVTGPASGSEEPENGHGSLGRSPLSRPAAR